DIGIYFRRIPFLKFQMQIRKDTNPHLEGARPVRSVMTNHINPLRAGFGGSGDGAFRPRNRASARAVLSKRLLRHSDQCSVAGTSVQNTPQLIENGWVPSGVEPVSSSVYGS